MLKERSISYYFSSQDVLPTGLPSLQPLAFSRIPGLLPDSDLKWLDSLLKEVVLPVVL